jgi:two-component system, OmpR family, phosphate regulon sensor histidine kinase PhoR
VSRRIAFTLFLSGFVLAGVLIAPYWSTRVGLALLVAAVSCVVLGRFFFNRSETAAASSTEDNSKRDGAGIDQAATVRDSLRSGALLETMMNGMREGMLVVDEEMRVVASNRTAHEIFNRIEGALEGHRLSELTRNPAIHSTFIASLSRSEQAETKVEMQGSGGPIFDLRVVPLSLDTEETLRGAMGVFFDITRLERLERVRQEFLSNVSHELRTPLTAIMAFIETLEDGAMHDGESSARFLSIIRKNAERMHNLISDILELSAIEARTVSVKSESVRLHLLVSDVITALASRASARRVTVRNEVADEVIVLADAHRLEQMITNLVDNAIKFNRENGLVMITHERLERDRIRVIDTGDGIPQEHVKRIFERFYRVDRARSRDMGGTGLGLAIVKHLARAHGGEVRVESTLGQGSTFTIELPALEAGESAEQQDRLSETSSRQNIGAGASFR